MDVNVNTLPTICDYTLLEFLGEGSTAHVYLAEHKTTKEQFAIKVIDKLLVRHAQLENKVRQEMVLHAQLRHRNVLQVDRVFEDARNYYMVLEFCAQRSLAAVLKSRPDRKTDEASAKTLFRAVVSGVMYLHEHGVIHRDLKLSNLLLTSDSEVKISDFGLATRLSDGHFTICGTPNFIAPEILANEGAYDEAVDIWSLGCILYCLLIGKPPFEGSKVSETLENVANAGNQPLVFPEGFSSAASDLIKRLLTSDPSRRPSAQQVLSHPWLRASHSARRKSLSSNPPVSALPPMRHHPAEYGATSISTHVVRGAHRIAAKRSSRKTKEKNERLPIRRKSANRMLLISTSQPADQRISKKDTSLSGSDDICSDSDDSDISLSFVASEFEDDDSSSVDSDNDEYRDGGEEDRRIEASNSGRSISKLIPSELDHSEAHLMGDEEEHEGMHERMSCLSHGETGKRSGDYTPSLVIRMDLQDIPFLGVEYGQKKAVEWLCLEPSEVGVPPKYLLTISNGWKVEYAPVNGILHGKDHEGCAVRYECVPIDGMARTFSIPNSDQQWGNNYEKLRTITRFCQCMALRSVQLRKNALQLESSKLPMIHYDVLPNSLLVSFREPTINTLIRQELHPNGAKISTSEDHSSRQNNSVVIAGIGTGSLDTQGNLTVIFHDKSRLILDANGLKLRFQPPWDDAREDVFELLTGSTLSAYLPSAVKTRLESVPVFIRRLQDRPPPQHMTST